MSAVCRKAGFTTVCRAWTPLVLAGAAATLLLLTATPAGAELTRAHIRSMTEQMRRHRAAWTDRDTTALLSLAGSGSAVVTVTGDDGRPRRIVVSGGDSVHLDVTAAPTEAARATRHLGAWFVVAVLLSLGLSLSAALNVYLLRATSQRGTNRADVIRSVSRL